jgi:hypothetical protein
MATWLWFIQTRADAYGTAATAEPSGYAGSRLDIDQECQRLSVFKHGASPTRFYGVELMSISRISCDFAGAIDANYRCLYLQSKYYHYCLCIKNHNYSP